MSYDDYYLTNPSATFGESRPKRRTLQTCADLRNNTDPHDDCADEHPVRRSLVAVAWLLEAVDDDDDVVENSTHNAHMQLLIDEFGKVYEANEGACRARDGEVAATRDAPILLL